MCDERLRAGRAAIILDGAALSGTYVARVRTPANPLDFVPVCMNSNTRRCRRTYAALDGENSLGAMVQTFADRTVCSTALESKFGSLVHNKSVTRTGMKTTLYPFRFRLPQHETRRESFPFRRRIQTESSAATDTHTNTTKKLLPCYVCHPRIHPPVKTFHER